MAAAADRQADAAERQASAERTQAITGIAALALTLFLVWYTREGLKVARASATAAKLAANVARDALWLAEAADVHLETFRYSNDTFNGDTRVSALFKNFGKTAARNVRISSKFGIGEELPTTDGVTPVVLGPGATSTQQMDKSVGESLGDERTRQVIAGTLPYRFRSRIEYDDAFKRPHWLEIVATFNPRHGEFELTHVKSSS